MGVKRWWHLTVPVFLVTSTVGATTLGTFTTTTFTTTTLTGATSTTSTLAGSLAPVANAGPDQFTQTLSTLTFNGSGSFDPGGTIVSYAWRFGDGGTASGIAVTHGYATAGIYTATLTVTDSRGASASDTAVVRVADRPPVANAGPDQSGILGSAVTLRGSGSDPDGTITSYRWDFGDGASASGATASHAYATAGTYTAKLTVTDDRGAQASDSALVAIAGSAAGTPWARGFGGAASDVGYGLAVDSSGNTVMTGRVESGVDFGGGVVCQPATVFVSKYSPAGARLWSSCLGGARAGGHRWSRGFGDSCSSSGDAVAVDPSGNIAVTGAFSGPADFGGGTLFSSGVDVFLAKLSPAGGHVWSRHFGAVLAVHAGNGVACDGSGNVLVTGSFENSIDLGGGWTRSFAHKDMFVAKYSPAGAYLWSKLAGGFYDDAGKAVAVDPIGKVVVTGTFQAAVNFGTGSLISAGRSDIFVARYSADGVPLATQRFGGADSDAGNGVAVDRSGRPVVTGSYRLGLDFGGTVLGGAGMDDIFLARLR